MAAFLDNYIRMGGTPCQFGGTFVSFIRFVTVRSGGPHKRDPTNEMMVLRMEILEIGRMGRRRVQECG